MRRGPMPICLLATTIVAQAPRDADALAAALRGDEAVAVARAAHEARELGDRALVKPLAGALHRWRDRGTESAPLVRLFLLDALHGLGARMPASDLVPALADPLTGTVAFLLLASEPQHNEAELLRVYRGDHDPTKAEDGRPPSVQLLLRQVAAAQLLAKQRTPGFAKELLLRADLRVHVTVVDGGPAQSWAPDHQLPSIEDEGFPAWPIYRLRERAAAEPKDLVIAPGPVDVCFTRSINPIRRARFRSSVVKLTPVPAADATDGLALLCAMAGGLPCPPRRLHLNVGPGYVARVTAARESVQGCIDALRERLVGDGLLLPEDAQALAAAVDVAVHDERKDTSTPLPAIPPQK